MIKQLVFIKRKPGVELEEFRDEATRRATAMADESGAGLAVLHVTHDTGYRAHEPSYDAVLELCFAVEHHGVDVGTFDDIASAGMLAVREVVIVDGPAAPGAVTMFAFLNRLPSTEPSAFQAYWRDHHGPIAGKVPGLRRYVQNHALSSNYAGGREPAYDGIPQTWFDDVEAMRASGGSDELAETRADELNFMVSGRLPFVVCTPVALREATA